ncbi:SIR2 family protein [Citricoccus sp. I39-566]|uniref:SIR2 family protein n=1 Tax=Citricoccus sp. I39-566 TaxID=3073268 RepID=UPI00286C5632|nr:SIR2 family protein [Citricoccus sp. I39-566]WMY80029.1 SIR2 family protein [Citricoccus sp. I39-566]
MDRQQQDELISLAFSLQSTPGSYAFVLGAGISVPSGVPSAWGVQEKLLGRLARIENNEPGNPFSWYEERFGEAPTYEGLLERLAPTQHDRQSILREFFEPNDEEREQGLKTPTVAHRSIARLIASGAARLVLTLNFDRLMETALRDEGIEPVVVSHPSDIRGLAPLHTLPATVIHLHGDYLSPTSMLNTKNELEAYGPEIEELLGRIAFDHGLIFVGWSATYDPALRHAVSSSARRVYRPYWIEPGAFSAVAEDLRTRIGATHIASDADTALGSLADAVESLAERNARHPLTLAAAVATAKRSLAARTTAIGLHDQIKQEVDLLHAQKDLVSSPTGTPSPDGGYPSMVARVEEATTVLTGLVATAAYWGDESTDPWWIGEIARLSVRSRGNGLTQVLELPKVSATHLFYAGGIAATAAGRYGLVRKLMETMAEDSERGPSPLCAVLSPEHAYEDSSAGKRLFEHLRPLFVQHLNIGAGKYEESWETFEFLRLVEATHTRQSAAGQIEDLQRIGQEVSTAQAEIDAARGTNDVDRLETAESTLRRTRHNFTSKLAEFASLVPAWSPYVHVQYARNGHGHVSVYGQQLIQQLEQQRQLHPYTEAGFCEGSWEAMRATCEAVDHAIGDLGRTAAYASLPQGSGVVPGYFRLGDLG